MGIEICPQCGGETAHETRQCPGYDGQPVCARHCYRECEYWKNDRCFWRQAHPIRNIADEIEKVNRRIDTTKSRIDYLYRRNQPWAAEKVERELKGLTRERLALMEEQRISNG